MKHPLEMPLVEPCKDAKCAAATETEHLCADHKAEYEQYLDDMAQLARIQEQYEQAG